MIINFKIMKDILDFISATLSHYQTSQLSHASNIMGKWAESEKYDSRKIRALEEITSEYERYLKANIRLVGYSEDIIRERVALLNCYYDFYHEHEYDNVFSSQGKFRSTILEEFMFLLFKDYVEFLKKKYDDTSDVIGSGSAKAYTNLYFTATSFGNFVRTPSVGINVKDQDFAIYRSFSFSVDGLEKSIKVPIVAIENKTYIDKTMLDGMIATADKIKTGNPYALYIAVTENYDVDLSVDPAYSRIDQIFVLRKSKRKEKWEDIDPVVVIKVLKTVREHVERPWADVEKRMRGEGVII